MKEITKAVLINLLAFWSVINKRFAKWQIALAVILIIGVGYSYFGASKKINRKCITNLSNDSECVDFLQGSWYWKRGSKYNYTEYFVEVNGEHIRYKYREPNQDWQMLKEGTLSLSNGVSDYWCCGRSVREIMINNSSYFLFITQSENENYGDRCGGLAWDGYNGAEIVGDEDFFQRNN